MGTTTYKSGELQMRRATTRRLFASATVLAITAAVMTTGAAAQAATSGSTAPVTVTATGACGSNRTLTVDDTSGTPLGSNNGLNATNGAAGFVTNVADAGQCDTGFSVTASMSNLYGYNGGTWTCGTDITSGNVTMAQGALPLTLSGISALIGSPNFALSTAFPANYSLLGIPIPNPSTIATQTGTLATALTQTNLGLANGILTNGGLAALPIQLTAGLTSSTFGTAATAPSGSNCSGGSSSPTNLTVMSGSNNAGLITTGLVNYLDNLNSLSAGTTTIPVVDLIANGILSQTQVLQAVLPAPLVNLLSQLTQNTLNTILSYITATVTTTGVTLANLTESGLYTALSTIAVNTTGATAGQYEGALTITLTS